MNYVKGEMVVVRTEHELRAACLIREFSAKDGQVAYEVEYGDGKPILLRQVEKIITDYTACGVDVVDLTNANPAPHGSEIGGTFRRAARCGGRPVSTS